MVKTSPPLWRCSGDQTHVPPWEKEKKMSYLAKTRRETHVAKGWEASSSCTGRWGAAQPLPALVPDACGCRRPNAASSCASRNHQLMLGWLDSPVLPSWTGLFMPRQCHCHSFLIITSLRGQTRFPASCQVAAGPTLCSALAPLHHQSPACLQTRGSVEWHQHSRGVRPRAFRCSHHRCGTINNKGLRTNE